MIRLRKLWNEVTRRYSGNRGLIDEFWTEIEEKYSAKSRLYHNLAHIEYMMEKAGNYQKSLKDPETILFAIFYHDIFYNTGRRDNEQKSTEIAQDRLSRLGLATGMIERCQEQILATKEHKDNIDSDKRKGRRS